MSRGFKKIFRDRLVDDAALRGFLSVSTTGSAPINPAFMERSGVYPQLVYNDIDGPTDPGMASENGFMTLSILVQATGSAHPVITYENIAKRLQELIDDTTLTGAQFSGTAMYCYQIRHEGGTPLSYDETRKVYVKSVSYSYKIRQY